jgi:hypothetical protein
MESIFCQTQPANKVAIYTSTPMPHHHRIADEFSVELRTRSSPGSIGVNWNTALGGSVANLVTLAHQDDLYAPDYLRKMLSAMNRVPDALIGFSGFTECDDQGVVGESFNTKVKRRLTQRAFGMDSVLHTPESKRRLLAWGNPICCPSVMFNRANLGDFSFREDLSSNLDWDAWTSLADRAGAFVIQPEVLVSKRMHQASETSYLLSNNRRASEDLQLFRRHWPAPAAHAIAFVYRMSYVANRLA